MRVVGIDVGEQGAHDGRHPRTHVLGGEAGKVAGRREWEKLGLASSQDRQCSLPERLQDSICEWLPLTLKPFPLADCVFQVSLCLLSGLPYLCSTSDSHPITSAPRNGTFPTSRGLQNAHQTHILCCSFSQEPFHY